MDNISNFSFLLEFPFKDRFMFPKKNGLCYNCLKDNPVKICSGMERHTARSCPDKFRSKLEGCVEKHHTLLHKPSKPLQQNNSDEIVVPLLESDFHRVTSKVAETVLLQVVHTNHLRTGGCSYNICNA